MRIKPVHKDQPQKLVLMYWEGRLKLYRVNVSYDEALDMMTMGKRIVESKLERK